MHRQLLITSVRNCSWLWRGGQLTPVPATRADVFAAEGLTLPQRRALMRFLTAAQAAMQGGGPLQVPCDCAARRSRPRCLRNATLRTLCHRHQPPMQRSSLLQAPLVAAWPGAGGPIRSNPSPWTVQTSRVMMRRTCSSQASTSASHVLITVRATSC